MASRCSLGLPYSARPATSLSFEGKGFARHDVGEQTSAFALCPPLASDKVAGSMDADLLEIEEVLGMRYCDPSQMTAVALNPVDEDDERLEYLVSGRFGRSRR